MSIIISNHNYARFLGECIGSALNQNHEAVEVIVVDDGSTDESRAIIQSYGKKIIPILQANRGQGAAINAGFRASHGQTVIFLDADDVLEKQAARRAMQVLHDHTGISKAQFLLLRIDATGRPLDPIPQTGTAHTIIDIRDRCHKLLDYHYPATSGNVYPRQTLQRILPVPEPIYRLCADHYLNVGAALLGPVIAVDQVFGRYRIHGANNYERKINMEAIHREIRYRLAGNRHLFRFASPHPEPKDVPAILKAMPDLRLNVFRMISKRSEPNSHPIKEDSVMGIWRDGVRCAMHHPEGAVKRLLYVGWFTVMLLPGRLNAPLVRQFLEQRSIRRVFQRTS